MFKIYIPPNTRSKHFKETFQIGLEKNSPSIWQGSDLCLFNQDRVPPSFQTLCNMLGKKDKRGTGPASHRTSYSPQTTEAKEQITTVMGQPSKTDTRCFLSLEEKMLKVLFLY